MVMGLLISACQIFTSPATPFLTLTPQTTPEIGTPSPIPTDTLTPVIDTTTPTATETLMVTITPDPFTDSPESAIVILEPAPGSQVASPVRVKGYANHKSDQELMMRIIQPYDIASPEISATIQIEPGERRLFEFEYHFDLEGDGTILVYTISTRDGAITHLSSAGVELVPNGPEVIKTQEPYLERIAIFSPSLSEVIKSGAVTVEGFGWGWQLVEIEILGENGDVIGSDFARIEWPEIGEPGPFKAVVPYSITRSQPGRVVVRDRSMAYDGFVHVNSVEVTLEMYPQLTEEAIMILEPAPGSKVASPVRVSGFANPTFEQNLLMRIVLEDGTVLPQTFTSIQADPGERGVFEFEYPFDLEGTALIQVYEVSTRDGGIIHLSSVEVTLAPDGPADIGIREPYSESLAIGNPAPSDEISGGELIVSGIGMRSYMPFLLVDLLDENGNEIYSTDIEFVMYEIGEHGTFWVKLAYSIDQPQVGRVVVRDPSWIMGKDFHLTSVDIMLEP
jgi:hypothetical protein